MVELFEIAEVAARSFHKESGAKLDCLFRLSTMPVGPMLDGDLLELIDSWIRIMIGLICIDFMLQKCTLCSRLVLQSCVFQLELQKCTSRSRLVLQSCDLRAGALDLYYKGALFELERCKISELRVRDLYYKITIFELELQKCTSRPRLVLQSCDFRAGAAEIRSLVAR